MNTELDPLDIAIGSFVLTLVVIVAVLESLVSKCDKANHETEKEDYRHRR